MRRKHAAVLAVLLLVAATASAGPARLLRVHFIGDCDAFTVVVSGEGLNQSSPTVSYNIILTPHSGEPMAIVDSFPVTPKKDGKFHKKVHGTWKTFEFTLTDAFTLSGSAILTSGLTLLHTRSITFSPATLSCKSKKMIPS